MKTFRQTIGKAALLLFAAAATRWWLGCEDDSQNQRDIAIDDVVDCVECDIRV